MKGWIFKERRNKIEDTKIFKKNPDIVSRTIEDETILIPIYKTSEETNSIYTLNKVAARIWELIDGKRNLAVIKKELLEEFDTAQKELGKELNTDVLTILALALIIPHWFQRAFNIRAVSSVG